MIVFISRRAQPAQGQATSAIRDPIRYTLMTFSGIMMIQVWLAPGALFYVYIPWPNRKQLGWNFHDCLP